ncbi:nSTAND1 domain-containing NTPase [Ornithinimicrobium cryptoxanthini]|uniref:Winged helix-turn-helix domain-containing protein n=1 Tax=Ornithinimicrobium cryptoxanthini TaxID=2934161 RepID=A0ABY4YME0_9MICO|nr:BTAD domain-containing putative transcriptional regulator [Ornithinimicrobium cryptoxanthini]USQ77322.1 winged helix-turn-helix domain-containing protein [Ornithinimicrobium cryptoxanthini]
MIEYAVLGPLEVTSDGEPVDLAGDRLRRLLVTLLVTRNRPVSVDRLVEAVFGEQAGPKAEATLRTYLTRLRHKLGTDLAVGHTDGGYVLHVPDEALDSAHFEQLVGQGRRALEYGDPTIAAATLSQALQLWRGAAYQGMDATWWVSGEAQRLADLRVTAVEHLADAQMLVGHGSDAVPNLREVLLEDPFRENLTARLMLALSTTGRTAEALTLYRQHRTKLSDELGIDPGPDLVQLHERILAGEPDLLHLVQAEQSLRGYQLGERLGSGPRGTVFSARLPGVDREYAVRVYRPEIADDVTVVRTFERDAHAAATVDSTSVVPIYDAWREPGLAALVMQRMTGGTLRDQLTKKAITPPMARHVAERVGGALLDYAARGLTHGDVRSDNVFFDAAGEAYLGDRALRTSDAGRLDDAAQYVELVRVCFAAASPDERHDWAVQPADDGPGGAVHSTVTAVLAHLRASAHQPGNPYVGLRRFEEQDADRFFGREALIERMEELVSHSRLLAVVGGSGSGKSSVVRAGLLPRLRRSAEPRWLITVMVPGSDPLDSLSEALRRVATTSTADTVVSLEEPEGLARVARALTPSGWRLLLVVDQLEEIYSHAEPEAAEALLDALAHASTAEDCPLSVVATVRADYFDRPLAHPTFGPLLRDATLPVAAMTPSELEAAVRGPAVNRLTLEPGLTSELVAAVAGRPAALPALQFTLHELASGGQPALTLSALRALGGVEGAIGSRAESMLSTLSATEQQLFAELLSRLVVVSAGEPIGTRITMSEVKAVSPEHGADLHRLMETWIAARLLSADRRLDTREPTVGLAHEALVEHWPRLRRWVEGNQARHRELADLARAAAQWRELGQDRGALLRGARLDRAIEALPPTGAPPDVAAFVAASRAQRDDEVRAATEAAQQREQGNRRLRRHRWLLAAALVVVVAIGAVAVERGLSAHNNALAAESRAQAAVAGLLASANDVADKDWPLALLLATEAYLMDDSSHTRRGLLTALSNPRPVGTLLYEEPAGLQALAVDADSGVAAVLSPEGELTVFDLETAAVVLGPVPVPVFPIGGGLDAAAGMVASGGDSTDGTGVVVHRIGEDQPVATLDTPIGQESKVAFSPDSSTLAVTSHGTVRLVDTTSWQVRARLSTPDPADPLLAVAWSSDGSRVYAGTVAGVYAWVAPSTETPGSVVAEPGSDEQGTAPDGVVDLPDSDEPAVFDLATIPGTDQVVATTFDGATYVLADHPLRIIEGPLSHDNVTVSLAASPDGQRIAVAAFNQAMVWQFPGTPQGRLEQAFPIATETIDLEFLSDGDLVTVGSAGEVTRWDLDVPSPAVAPLTELGAGIPTFSPSGELLAMAGWGHGARLFDGRTLQPLVTLDIPDPDIVSVAGLAFHPDEDVVYVLSCTGTELTSREYCPGELTAYDTGTGAPVAGPVTGGSVSHWVPTLLAVNSDGTMLASGRIGGLVELHDPSSLETTAVLDDLEGSPEARFVIQVDFAPDEPQLVASVGDLTGVWDLTGTTPELIVKQWTGVTAGFAPTGELVTSSQSGRVYLREPTTLRPLQEAGGLPMPLVNFQFTDDGSMMVTSDDATGAVRLWSLPELESFGGPLPGAYSDIRPDGSLVVIGGAEASSLTLDPTDWVQAACDTAGRDLTDAEWGQYFGSVPYRPTCPTR